MAKDFKNLNKLQKLFDMMDEESLTKQDFKEAFAKVVDFVKQINDKNKNEITRLNQFIEQASKKVQGVPLSDFDGLKFQVGDDVKNKMDEFNNYLNGKMKEVDDRMSMVKDGKDADEGKVAMTVTGGLKPMLLTEMKNEVNSAYQIMKDDMEKELLKRVDEMIREFKEQRIGKGGGGFSNIAMQRHFVDDETPIGTMDGVNTTFTLAKLPYTGSLKLYRNGQRQRVTDDFTLAGKEIEFAIAPESDEIILADYRF